MSVITIGGRGVAAGRVDKDVACYGCGYNLRGLHRSGTCPECGESIETAVRGDALALSDADWLRGLQSGATVLLAGLAAPWLALATGVAVLIGLALLRMNESNIVWVAGILVGFLVVLGPPLVVHGATKFLAAEPREASPQGLEAQRRLGVTACGVAAGLWCVAAIGGVFDVRILVAGAMLAVIASSAGVWGVSHWIDDLARRTPDRVLARRTRLLRGVSSISAGIIVFNGFVFFGDWLTGGPITPLPGLVGLLGVLGLPLGLLGGMWSVGLLLGTLDETRRMIARARRAQQEAAARTTRNATAAAASLR